MVSSTCETLVGPLTVDAFLIGMPLLNLGPFLLAGGRRAHLRKPLHSEVLSTVLRNVPCGGFFVMKSSRGSRAG